MALVQRSCLRESAPRRVRARRLVARTLATITLCCAAGCDFGRNDGVTVTYEIADASATPLPLPPAPRVEVDITREQAIEVYERFVRACKRKDAKALWDLLVDEIQQASERRAAVFRADPGVLRNIIHYKGPSEGFTAFEFHRFDSFVGFGPLKEFTLCGRVEAWTTEVRGPEGREYLLIVKHPKGLWMGFFLRRDAGGHIRVRTTEWDDSPDGAGAWLTSRFHRGEEDSSL